MNITSRVTFVIIAIMLHACLMLNYVVYYNCSWNVYFILITADHISRFSVKFFIIAFIWYVYYMIHQLFYYYCLNFEILCCLGYLLLSFIDDNNTRIFYCARTILLIFISYCINLHDVCHDVYYVCLVLSYE